MNMVKTTCILYITIKFILLILIRMVCVNQVLVLNTDFVDIYVFHLIKHVIA